MCLSQQSCLFFPLSILLGGFMLTPRYDDDPELLRAAVGDLAQCCLEVVEEMKWPDEDLLPRVRA